MRVRTRHAALLGVFACLVGVIAAGSQAATIKYGDLVLVADGGFSPHALPRHRHAPIEINGHASIRSRSGRLPSKLEQVVLDFDRDGLLSTRGLGVCPPARIEHASVAGARRKCKSALVGTGTVSASVLIEGRRLRVRAPLSLFNGPPGRALASVVAHAQPVSIPGEIYVVTIPIERTQGDFGYRATVEVPEIFNPTGLLTDVSAEIGRTYRAGGHERSYVSARCSDGTLAVHGRFTFGDGTVVDGAVEQFCLPSGEGR